MISAAALSNLMTAIGNFTTQVTALVKQTGHKAVSEYVTVAVGANKEYDLQTLLGAAYSLYDLPGVVVTVRVKDSVVASATYNMYVNAEAFVTVAIRSERYVRVINSSDASVDLLVRIDVTRKLS